MADELAFNFFLNYSNDGTTIEFPFSFLSDVASAPLVDVIQTIATSATAVNIGSIATCGVMVIANLDTENYVKVRIGASGADVVKVLPGEAWPFRLAASTPYAIADTASVNCRILLWSA